MNEYPGLPDLKFAGIDPVQCGLEGRRISYMEAGNASAPPLLLLHGIGSNSSGWRFILNALASQYRVIAWNAPGYMLSDNFSTEKPNNCQYADAVSAFLDTLGYDSVSIVGSSFGSLVAASFAARYPARVQRLVLSGSSRGQKHWPPAERRAALDGRKVAMSDGPLAMAELRWTNLVAPNPPERTIRLVQEILKAVNPRGFLQAAETSNSTDVVEFAGKITAPTLLAIGDKDRVNPPEVTQVIHRAIPSSRVVELKDVGHLPKLEVPEIFVQVLKDHIGAVK